MKSKVIGYNYKERPICRKFVIENGYWRDNAGNIRDRNNIITCLSEGLLKQFKKMLQEGYEPPRLD